jgi:hypothetical protein
VDAVLQPDGTALAQRVGFMMGSGGMMADGVVTGVSGAPATELTLVMQDGDGSGVSPSELGSGYDRKREKRLGLPDRFGRSRYERLALHPRV